MVVLIHGGGWKDSLGLAYMENQARDLASFDVAVWNIEYRPGRLGRWLANHGRGRVPGR